MAEIKSTLDLVMERTKNLFMTEEEKRGQKLQEFKASLSGLILRYRESTLSMEQLKREIRILQETTEIEENRVVTEDLASRLDPDENNEAVLSILQGVCGADTSRVSAVIAEYAAVLRSEALAEMDHASARLRERHGVSGSAVVPNLSNDREWAETRRVIRDRFTAQLKEAADAL